MCAKPVCPARNRPVVLPLAVPNEPGFGVGVVFERLLGVPGRQRHGSRHHRELSEERMTRAQLLDRDVACMSRHLVRRLDLSQLNTELGVQRGVDQNADPFERAVLFADLERLLDVSACWRELAGGDAEARPIPEQLESQQARRADAIENRLRARQANFGQFLLVLLRADLRELDERLEDEPVVPTSFGGEHRIRQDLEGVLRVVVVVLDHPLRDERFGEHGFVSGRASLVDQSRRVVADLACAPVARLPLVRGNLSPDPLHFVRDLRVRGRPNVGPQVRLVATEIHGRKLGRIDHDILRPAGVHGLQPLDIRVECIQPFVQTDEPPSVQLVSFLPAHLVGFAGFDPKRGPVRSVAVELRQHAFAGVGGGRRGECTERVANVCALLVAVGSLHPAVRIGTWAVLPGLGEQAETTEGTEPDQGHDRCDHSSTLACRVGPKRGEELSHRGVAVLRVSLQSPFQRLDDPGRHVATGRHGHTVAADELTAKVLDRAACVRAGSEQSFVQRDTKRELVARGSNRGAGDLLRGHVRRRPHDRAGHREVVVLEHQVADGGTIGRRRRESKVEHDHPPLRREHDVLWLEVAMNEPRIMGGGQPLTRVEVELEDLPEAEARRARSVAGPALESLALDELHRDEDGVVHRADVMHRGHVAVVEPGHRPGFAEQACVAFVGCRVTEQLDRDAAIELRVVGRVHDTHAALTERFQDHVAPERRSAPDGRVRRRRRSTSSRLDRVFLATSTAERERVGAGVRHPSYCTPRAASHERTRARASGQQPVPA